MAVPRQSTNFWPWIAEQLGQLGNHSGAITIGQGTQGAEHQTFIQGEQLQTHHTGLGQARSL